MFVSNPSNLAHICQSTVYFKSTVGPKSNPIHQIFTKSAPFPSISTPYPFPYGFPLHWRALVYIHTPPMNCVKGVAQPQSRQILTQTAQPLPSCSTRTICDIPQAARATCRSYHSHESSLAQTGGTLWQLHLTIWGMHHALIENATDNWLLSMHIACKDDPAINSPRPSRCGHWFRSYGLGAFNAPPPPSKWRVVRYPRPQQMLV